MNDEALEQLAVLCLVLCQVRQALAGAIEKRIEVLLARLQDPQPRLVRLVRLFAGEIIKTPRASGFELKWIMKSKDRPYEKRNSHLLGDARLLLLLLVRRLDVLGLLTNNLCLPDPPPVGVSCVLRPAFRGSLVLLTFSMANSSSALT